MKKTTFTSAFLLTSIALQASAIGISQVDNNATTESAYNVDSRVLTIPSVKIGNDYVYNARLKLNDLGSFDIIEYSETPPIIETSVTCTSTHITLDKRNQISIGMTLDQVNHIMGCEESLISQSSGIVVYSWSDSALPPIISVTFINNVVDQATYSTN